MAEPIIQRYEVITVQNTQQNQYGDLIVNGSLKVGKKRSNLFNVFQPGAEIKVGYAIYMNKEYIATAEQTGTHVIPEEGHLVKAAKEMGAEVIETKPEKMTPEMWDAKEARTRKSIERQKALELTLNLVIADKIPLQEASTWALKFEKYLEFGK